jgi:putative acetyltransferase
LKTSAINVRPEIPRDIPGIRRVNESAFPTTAEASLVDLCRQRGRMHISLAALDGQRVVGHALFTPVTLDPPHLGWRGLALGPVAVLPEFQGQGIGSRLMTLGLELCRGQGIDFVVLLGDPRYYTRFGFIPGREFGLSSEYGDGDEFQAREIRPGVLREARGVVKYLPEFAETVG